MLDKYTTYLRDLPAVTFERGLDLQTRPLGSEGTEEEARVGGAKCHHVTVSRTNTQ